MAVVAVIVLVSFVALQMANGGAQTRQMSLFKVQTQLEGKWSRSQMEVESYFLFGKNEIGSFQFGLVQGQIDYRIEKIGEIERLEFSFEGQDENDMVSGRGWAVIKGDSLKGKFCFYWGDDSWFKAKKYR